MSFKSDVQKTKHLEDAWRPGIQALKAGERSRVALGETNALRGSADVDSSLRGSQPTAARWDYVIAQSGNPREKLTWLEIHPASGGACFEEIRAKHTWLMQWMESTPFKVYERRFVWLASGRCAYNRNHPKVKSLERKGVILCGRRLTL